MFTVAWRLEVGLG